MGAVLGAVLVSAAKTYLTGALPEVWLFALGALFILVTIFLPTGIIGPAAPAPSAAVPPWPRRGAGAMTRPHDDTLLYLDDVTVSFDGFRALNALSLVMEHGEMRAVIGPNGAGKTTMMDVITGKTRPDEGRVVFGAEYRPDPPR